MQTLELQKMGLSELGKDECVEVNGGNPIVGLLLKSLIDNFEEAARGLQDGWNFNKKKTK
ncbi:MAG: hypothetical protein ABW174_00580 [Flavitalea sp.]